MAKSLPTVWKADPHTFAKHAILHRYLDAWFPILSQHAGRLFPSTQEILFIDGFAGPGEYDGGEPGSPTIALMAAFQHSLEFPVPVRFLFFEEDAKELFQNNLSKFERFDKVSV